MTEEELAQIESEHQPDSWLKEHRGLLWCKSPDCNQNDITGAVHVDWPCDAARLVTEVRRLREQMRLGNTDPDITLSLKNTIGAGDYVAARIFKVQKP